MSAALALLAALAAPEPAPAAAAAPAPAAPVITADQATAPEVDAGILDGRRRPGAVTVLPPQAVQVNRGAVRAGPPSAFPEASLAVPDRYRILTSLCPGNDQSIYTLFGALRDLCHTVRDPYHQNVLKGDRPIDREKVKWLPIKEDDWYFEGSAISDSAIEPFSVPLPVGVVTTQRPGSNDLFGRNSGIGMAQTFIVDAALIKGMTTFKPPEIEYHLTVALNLNYASVHERQILNVDSAFAPHRFDHFLALQSAFIDYHLRNTSDRYDFDAVRVGIQKIQADFRGFLFQDEPLGIRLFGNRDNNRFQYNLAALWRIEKDTNSGLNDVTQRLRRDWVFMANLYRQDLFVPGLTGQVSVTYNRNREGGDVHYDSTGCPVRPALLGTVRGHAYDVVYLGANLDGHVQRLNVTASSYLALGQDRNNVYTGQPAAIRAWMVAGEASLDRDWMRFRLSGLYASGASDPTAHTETGFDAILENPVFAGADTSYWIRQGVPFIGGGRGIALSGHNGVLNSLRSSKDEGQSNFINPGTALVGAGGDFDLTPQLRLSTNLNHLWFAKTHVLELMRMQGTVHNDIGWDLSTSAIWRPKASQNIVARLSGAMLASGQGMRDLFGAVGHSANFYSLLANVIVSY